MSKLKKEKIEIALFQETHLNVTEHNNLATGEEFTPLGPLGLNSSAEGFEESNLGFNKILKSHPQIKMPCKSDAIRSIRVLKKEQLLPGGAWTLSCPQLYLLSLCTYPRYLLFYQDK